MGIGDPSYCGCCCLRVFLTLFLATIFKLYWRFRSLISSSIFLQVSVAITFAKQAYLTSGHKTSGVTDINVMLVKVFAAAKVQHPKTYKATMRPQFSIIYNRELKVLFDGG